MTSSSGGYTVKQVAALTGVLETTLRVWERRYGIVTPTRTPSGYRLYSDADVARLRSMARLVIDGVPASVAARTLLDHPGNTVSELPIGEHLDLVAAAASLETSRLDAVVREALASGPLPQVVDAWLIPELVRLGQAWDSGEIGVAHEHFASAGVMRALGDHFSAITDVDPDLVVLVGLPAGATHALALLAFAACLRSTGVDVVYLGADIPTDEWLRAAHERRPRGAGVGVPQGARAARAQELVHALTQATPPIAVWVGGALATRVRGAHYLPDSLSAAAAAVALGVRAGLVG